MKVHRVSPSLRACSMVQAIAAHDNTLSAIALCHDGTRLATTSERGAFPCHAFWVLTISTINKQTCRYFNSHLCHGERRVLAGAKERPQSGEPGLLY